MPTQPAADPYLVAAAQPAAQPTQQVADSTDPYLAPQPSSAVAPISVSADPYLLGKPQQDQSQGEQAATASTAAAAAQPSAAPQQRFQPAGPFAAGMPATDQSVSADGNISGAEMVADRFGIARPKPQPVLPGGIYSSEPSNQVLRKIEDVWNATGNLAQTLGLSTSVAGRKSQATIATLAEQHHESYEKFVGQAGGDPRFLMFKDAVRSAIKTATIGVADKTIDAPNRSTAAKVVDYMGDLGGMMLAPYPAAGALENAVGLADVFKVAAGDSRVIAIAKDMARQGITLGAVSGAEATPQAMSQRTVGGALSVYAHNTLSGFTSGLIFGAAGRINPTNKVLGYLARAAAINAGTDALNGTWPGDNRPLEQKVPEYLMNFVFAAMPGEPIPGAEEGGTLPQSGNATPQSGHAALENGHPGPSGEPETTGEVPTEPPPTAADVFKQTNAEALKNINTKIAASNDPDEIRNLSEHRDALQHLLTPEAQSAMGGEPIPSPAPVHTESGPIATGSDMPKDVYDEAGAATAPERQVTDMAVEAHIVNPKETESAMNLLASGSISDEDFTTKLRAIIEAPPNEAPAQAAQDQPAVQGAAPPVVQPEVKGRSVTGPAPTVQPAAPDNAGGAGPRAIAPEPGAGARNGPEGNKPVQPVSVGHPTAPPLVGVHFSQAHRDVILGNQYGSGIRGAEAKRLNGADPRLSQRVAFYVDAGNGVKGEPGVGAARHDVRLTNLYDGEENPLHFSRDPNTFEEQVLDHGYDGYYMPKAFQDKGAAVLLGPAAERVRTGAPEMPSAQRHTEHSVVFSAERKDKTPAENAKATADAEAQLKQHGVKYTKVDGSYEGSKEKSFLVGMRDADVAKDIATKTKQDSVLVADHRGRGSFVEPKDLDIARGTPKFKHDFQLHEATKAEAEKEAAYSKVGDKYYVTKPVVGEKATGSVPETARTLRAPIKMEAIDKNETLSPRERTVESKFAAQINTRPQEFAQAYVREYGKIISGDKAKELSEDYAKSHGSRTALAAAVHEPASALAKAIYTAMLREPVPEGREPLVMFTAGGTGAGKTRGLAILHDDVAKADIIYDTNLSSYQSAKNKITQAIDSGRKVEIVYTHTNPTEAYGSMKVRQAHQGRVVPLDAHVETHVGALDTVRKLAIEYKGNPDVSIRVLDRKGGAMTETSLDKLPEKYDTQQVLEEIENEHNLQPERSHKPAGQVEGNVPRGEQGTEHRAGPSGPDTTGSAGRRDQAPRAAGSAENGNGASDERLSTDKNTEERMQAALQFSRGGDVRGENAESAAVSLLGQAPDAFKYPRSDSTDMRQVANDVERGASTKFEVQKSLRTHANSALGKIDEEWEVRPKGAPATRTATITRVGRKVWLNIGRFAQGGEGSAVYQMVGDWAHNNNYKFIGDPEGLSDVALRRRTSQMLSSAARWNTTEHLEPAQEQLEGDKEYGVPTLKWRDGDDAYNMQQLAKTEAAYVQHEFPEIKSIEFNPQTKTFQENGHDFTDADFKSLVVGKRADDETGTVTRALRHSHAGVADTGGLLEPTKYTAGVATLKRAVLFKTVADEARDGKRGTLQVLADVLGKESRGDTQEKPASLADTGGVLPEALHAILYSRADAEPTRGEQGVPEAKVARATGETEEQGATGALRAEPDVGEAAVRDTDLQAKHVGGPSEDDEHPWQHPGIKVVRSDASRRIERHLIANNNGDIIGQDGIKEVTRGSMRPEQRAMLDAFDEVSGARVTVITGIHSGVDAFRVKGTNSIYISADASKPWLRLAGHEFTHFLKESDPDLYDKLDAARRAQVSDSITPLAQRGRDASAVNYAGARPSEEFLGDAVGNAFTDPNFWDHLSKKNTPLFKRVVQAFHDFMSKVLSSVAARKFPASEYFADLDAFHQTLADVLDQLNKGPVKDAGDIAESLSGAATSFSHVRDDIGGAEPEKEGDNKIDDLVAPNTKDPLALRARITLKDRVDKIKRAYGSAFRDLAPSRSEPVAAEIADRLGMAIARNERAEAVMWKGSLARENFLNKLASNQRLDFLNKYEHGHVFKDPQLKRLADFYKTTFQTFDEQEHGMGLEYGSRENYFSHYFYDPDKVQRYFATKYPHMVGKPGFAKMRTFDYMREAIEAGFKPISDNPEVLFRMRYADHLRFGMQRAVVSDLNSIGLLRPAEAPQPDQEKLKDGNYVKVNEGEAFIRMPDNKTYITSLNGARFLKNALFQESLWTKRSLLATTFRGWMELKSAIIPLQLGASAYHFNHVFIGVRNAQGSANVLRSLMDHEGPLSATDYANAAMEYTKQISGLGANWEDTWGLRHGVYDASKPGSQAQNMMAQYMVEGGFTPTNPREYRGGDAEKKLHSAWTRQEYGKVAVNAIPAVMRQLQKPIMDWAVPFMKTQAYISAVKNAIEADKGLVHDSRARVRKFSQIRRQIDERFGELPYNKLFWDQHLTGAVQSAFLSFTWNYGFVKQFPGGAFDLAKAAVNVWRPSRAQAYVTERAWYAFHYMVLTFVVGGLIHSLVGGEKPKTLKDFVYPMVGRDAHGNPERVNTMFFTREFGAMYYHFQDAGMKGLAQMLVYKGNPVFSELYSQLTNKDFYDHQISDPLASIPDQVKQRATALAHSLLPFSVAGNLEQHRTSAKDWALSLSGFNPAPGYVDKAPIVEKIYATYGDLNSSTITYQQAQQIEARRQLRGEYLNAGKQQFMSDLMKFSKQYMWSQASVRDFMSSLSAPEGASEFRQLPPEYQLRLMEKEMSEPEALKYIKYAAPRARQMYVDYFNHARAGAHN